MITRTHNLSKRDLSFSNKKKSGKAINLASDSKKPRLDNGIVTSEQLAAELQFLEIEFGENPLNSLKNLYLSLCTSSKFSVALLQSQALANPTHSARALLGRNDIITKANDGLLEVFPCFPLQSDEFNFTAMIDTCYQGPCLL